MAKFSSLRTANKIKPIHFVKQGEIEDVKEGEIEEFEHKEPSKPKKFQRKNIEAFGVLDGREWILQQHGEEESSEKKRSAIPLENQLYITFSGGKRPPTNELRALHSDIITVLEPRSNQRWCIVTFADKFIAQEACKALRRKKVNGSWLRVNPRAESIIFNNSFEFHKIINYKKQIQKMKLQLKKQQELKLDNDVPENKDGENKLNGTPEHKPDIPVMNLKNAKRKVTEKIQAKNEINETTELEMNESLMKQWQRKALMKQRQKNAKKGESNSETVLNKLNDTPERKPDVPVMKWKNAKKRKVTEKIQAKNDINETTEPEMNESLMKQWQRKALIKQRRGMQKRKN